MNEHLLTFGTRRHLVGTHAPAQGAARPVAFIMLNAGVIHRVGPRRFNVKLARDLAREGYHSLRIDLSGQGDSVHGGGVEAYEDQVCADLSAAMDALEAATGAQRFVIAGICSGAQAGFNVAQRDARVAGLWMLDGPAYPTVKSTLVRLWHQWRHDPAASAAGWMRTLVRRLRRGAGMSVGATAQGAGSGNPRGAPALADYAEALERLDARGVRLYLMYSSDMLWQYSYAGQFRDTFRGRRFVDTVCCERLAHADHTLTTVAAQQEVMQRIRHWALAHW